MGTVYKVPTLWPPFSHFDVIADKVHVSMAQKHLDDKTIIHKLRIAKIGSYVQTHTTTAVIYKTIILVNHSINFVGLNQI